MSDTPDTDFTNNCCFNCGGDQFAWGLIVVADPQLTRPQPTFQPDEQPKRHWFASPFREGLRARKCLRCGNLQAFVDSFVADKAAPVEPPPAEPDR